MVQAPKILTVLLVVTACEKAQDSPDPLPAPSAAVASAAAAIPPSAAAPPAAPAEPPEPRDPIQYRKDLRRHIEAGRAIDPKHPDCRGRMASNRTAMRRDLGTLVEAPNPKLREAHMYALQCYACGETHETFCDRAEQALDAESGTAR